MRGGGHETNIPEIPPKYAKKGQGVKISTSKYHFRGQKWVLHTQSLGQIFIRDHQKNRFLAKFF